ncbi:MAG: SpoIVB peptidase S55 domain-containing protein, partial [bacterium]
MKSLENTALSFRFDWILAAFAASLLLILANAPATASAPDLPDTATLSPDEVKQGMTGYGKTVFYNQSIDTFHVKVVGVLENIMPGQDMILIKAQHPLLETTKIMSGMSGSPIYINGKLIGALAYSWPFAKESLAGVTPIENMFRLGDRQPTPSSNPGGVEQIATPIALSGFNDEMKPTLKSKLKQKGFKGEFIAGGQTSGTEKGPTSNQAGNTLEEGSAV